MVEKPLLKAKDDPFFNPFLGGSVSQEWVGQFDKNGWVNLNENGWVSLARIYTGSTKARTRLYRMGIAKYLSEVTKDFEILGERNDEWGTFRKNIEYDGFLVRRKKKK